MSRKSFLPNLRLNKSKREYLADEVAEQLHGEEYTRAIGSFNSRIEKFFNAVILRHLEKIDVDNSLVETWETMTDSHRFMVPMVPYVKFHGRKVTYVSDPVPHSFYLLISSLDFEIGEHRSNDVELNKETQEAFTNLINVEAQMGEAKENALKYLAKFSNPKDLIEACPEIEMHIPADWYEEVNTTTLEEIANAKAA